MANSMHCSRVGSSLGGGSLNNVGDGSSKSCAVSVGLHGFQLTVNGRRRSSLGVDTDAVLGTTWADKATALLNLEDSLVNARLEADRRRELALSVGRVEDVTVGNLDLDETVGEVLVAGVPLLGAPAPVGKNNLDEKHVRKRITNGLVDELGQGNEVLDSAVLVGALRLGLLQSRNRVVREQNSAVAVGLKVDANVIVERGVVEVLDTGGGASDGQVALRKVRRE